MRERLILSEASVPVLPRHVRLRHDETRGRWLLLAPERVLTPDDTALMIVKLFDGQRSLGSIIDELAQKFAAPRDVIAKDVIAMLQDLADKGFLESAAPASVDAKEGGDA